VEGGGGIGINAIGCGCLVETGRVDDELGTALMDLFIS
jgi:hypothetical protein